MLENSQLFMESSIHFKKFTEHIMKKLLYWLLPFVLIACEDITLSDPNKIENIVKYTKILDNQEQSVIMPLSAGRKWMYLHKYYNNNGDVVSTTKDSIFVEGEYTDNNEKWFKVYNIIFNDSVYMTNTDKGLWYKCQLCDNTSYLEAEYPEMSPYNSTKFTVWSAVFDSIYPHIYTDTCYKYYEVSKENVTVPKGSYQTIKYKVKTINLTNNSNITFNTYNSYYVPDLGLVKLEKLLNGVIQETYELKNNFDITQNKFEIDMGALLKGESSSGNFSVLTNSTGSNVKIISIDYISAFGMNLEILPYNNSIADNSVFLLPLKISPTVAGNLESIITIKTDAGDFKVKVKCYVR